MQNDRLHSFNHRPRLTVHGGIVNTFGGVGMNKWDEMREAFKEAEIAVKAADAITNDMARMLRGRLRKVDGWLLADLKRELRDFNIHTSRWNK